MTTARRFTVALALVLAPALLGACGESPGTSGDSSAAGSGTLAATTPTDTGATRTTAPPGVAPPTATPQPGLTQPPDQPAGPPRTPSDLVPTDVLVGTIMADSDGSCYFLQTDDGDSYALVGGDRRPLERGTVVRVKITDEPPPRPVTCPGEPVTIGTLEVV